MASPEGMRQQSQTLGRRARLREATREEIKQLARQQMAEQGTAALSLLGIARQMGVTGPALYRYFPTRDALVTALVVEAYASQARAMEQAVETAGNAAYTSADADLASRTLAAILAYRAWALQHPVDYALLAGNPVPGYVPPRDVVVAAARRGLDLFVGLVEQALRTGTLVLPEIKLTPSLRTMLTALAQEREYAIPVELLYLLLAGWGEIQGLVTLEVFHQIDPLLADVGELYRCEAHAWLRRLGFQSVPPLLS